MDMIKDKEIVFLLCSERSGSNFVTRLMNNHSKVCGPSTKHIINPLARNYFRYQPLESQKNWEAILNDILNLFNVDFSIWKSGFTKEELLKEVNKGDISGLIRYFFSKETHANGKKLCFIKEIKTYEFYSFLKAYFDKSKFLYQVRDPRDMALSWKKNKTHKGGVVAAAKQWKNDQQQYLKIAELEKPSNSIAIVNYENLVSNTETELKRILDVIELTYEPSMLDMEKDKLTAKNAKTQKAWENLSKPIMSSNFGKYKDELSEHEIKLIESICYFEMNHLGYKSNYEWGELKQIKSTETDEFHKNEILELPYEPAAGVKLNMIAKQSFYQYPNK